MTERIAALSRFVSKVTDKCLSFFKALKNAKGLEWSEEYEWAFQDLKTYFGSPPLLLKPKEGETP